MVIKKKRCLYIDKSSYLDKAWGSFGIENPKYRLDVTFLNDH